MKWRMLVDDILELRSGDSYDFGIRGTRTVKDVLEDKELDHEIYERIRKVMAREGINLVPVEVRDDMLYNGHHRVKLALELGFEEILATDEYHTLDAFDHVAGEE